MHELYELKEKLCEELKEFGGKEMSVGDLEVVDKLSHAIKNLDKIIETYEETEASYADGGNYEGGGSYRQGGRSYRSYARGRGSNARRDAMGRYSSERGGYRGGRSGRSYDGGMSYGDGTEEMIEAVREMMNDLPENAKREAQRFVQKLEQEMM